MADQPDDPRFRDPLSEVTRKERKFLLAASSATILLTSLHEKVTKIPAIETDQLSVGSQRAILIALALVVGYALVAFVIYAWTDFVSWRQIIAKSDVDLLSKMLYPVDYMSSDEVFGNPDPAHREELKAAQNLALGRNSKWSDWARRVSIWRAGWDFSLPIIVGVTATAMAIWRAVTAG
jgi:hypothetical protein